MLKKTLLFSVTNQLVIESFSLRLQGYPLNYTIIQMYSPTSDAEDQDIQDFYDKLQQVVDTMSNRDPLFIIEDFNAKVTLVTFKAKVKGVVFQKIKTPFLSHCSNTPLSFQAPLAATPIPVGKMSILLIDYYWRHLFFGDRVIRLTCFLL